MGGGEVVPAGVHKLCQRGLRNVLLHCGVLHGEAEVRQRPVRWVQALDREDYRFAPESGLWESCVDLGETVGKGDVVGRIHFLERPDREAVEVLAHADGMLIAGRAPSIVKQGDCVACIAHDVDPYTLPAK